MRRLPLLPVILTVGACTAPASSPPSLAPRPAETIDPRLPVETGGPARPVAPALAARLAELVEQARAGAAAFDDAAGRAEQLAASAGVEGSDSWVAAQQALSVAVAARAPTTRALGDIDELAASAIAAQGGIAPADRAAIEAAAAEVRAIDSRQAQRIDALQARVRS